VETAQATVGVLRATVNEDGKTRIKQRFLVSAPVTGQLRRVPFKAGAMVNAGTTVLAVIDPLSPTLLDVRSRTLAEARRDTALANREKARAAHTFALSELHRFEKLYQDKTISPQELENVQWREVSAAREEAAAESALRQAEAELAQSTVTGLGAGATPVRETGTNTCCPTDADPPVHNGNTVTNDLDGSAVMPIRDSATNSYYSPIPVRAPVSGRVLRVLEESARVVTAGTPLLEIGDPANLEVVIETLSRDGAAIGPGTKVELEQWGGDKPLTAQVRLVEPAAFTKISALGVEEQRVNVIADLLTPFEQRPTLGDNFRVEARIIVWETNQALKVPSGALFRRGQQWAAFVVSGGRARVRLVKVGRSSANETQVLEGLTAGEEVILYPGDRVHEGQRVKPIKV
jgi:HlyD family secretion protein